MDKDPIQSGWLTEPSSKGGGKFPWETLVIIVVIILLILTVFYDQLGQ